MHKKDLLNIINDLKLNLDGKVILTEAASGPYMVTPILASLSGAKKVYAFAKTTKYGTSKEVFSFFNKQLERLNINNIKLIDTLKPDVIGEADIITNSGHLRPLNEDKLKHFKKNAVISLMYEKWEFRDSDIDIKYCRKKDIKVGAINERHKRIDVFSYLGDMVLKLIFDSGLCLYNNKYILLCNNDFGPYIAQTLSKVCLKLGIIAPEKDKHLYKKFNIDWLSNFPETNIPKEYCDTKAIIFSAYPFDKTWIGNKETPIAIQNIKEKIDFPYILRFAGDIDTSALSENNVRYYPTEVKSGHMGIIPSEIGFDPIIRLQAGGLKAGECLLRQNFRFEEENIVEIV